MGHVFTVPCEWHYGDYEVCTKTCGGGTKTRFPIITQQPEHGGYCPDHVLNRDPDTEPCNTQSCPSKGEIEKIKQFHYTY